MNNNQVETINGLKGIALIALIVSLLNLNSLSGGFLGIDFFFCIIGYLNIKILLNFKDIKLFSFFEYYIYKIKKISPSLIILIVISIPISYLTLIPFRNIEYAQSIIYSLLFFSNYFFWAVREHHFFDYYLYKPLLHLWGLSILIQFYIFFIPCLVFIIKKKREFIFLFLILILSISLSLSSYLSLKSPGLNFYFTATRIWEFALGGIIAFQQLNKKNNYNGNLPVLFSFFLILISLIFYNQYTLHPSPLTLIPLSALGTILYFSERNNFINKILSTKILSFFGIISFSLFLWGNTIFAFTNLFEFQYDLTFNSFTIILIILLVSILNHFLIYKKFLTLKFNKYYFIFFGSLIFISTSYSYLVISVHGLNNQKSDIKIEGTKTLYQNNIECSDLTTTVCEFNKENKKTIFLIGDSHMEILAYDLKEFSRKNNFRFIVSTPAGSPFLLNSSRIIKSTNKTDSRFEKIMNLRKKIISENENIIVILGARYPFYFSDKPFDNKEGGKEKNVMFYNFSSNSKNSILDEFKSGIEEYANQGVKFILIYPIPEVGWHVPNKLYFKNSDDLKKKPLTTSLNVYLERSKYSFDFLDRPKNKNIYRFYPHTVFCDSFVKQRCVTHNQKYSYYMDFDHMSFLGSKLLTDELISTINDIKN